MYAHQINLPNLNKLNDIEANDRNRSILPSLQLNKQLDGVLALKKGGASGVK